MKLKFAFLFLIFSTSIYAQIFDGYKYVYVPTIKYRNSGNDFPPISSQVRRYFNDIGLTVWNEDTKPSKEIIENPCINLTCTINTEIIEFKTYEVEIKITNCKGDILWHNKERSGGTDDDEIYRRATYKALANLGKLTYKFNAISTPIDDIPPVEQTNETESTIRHYLTTNKTDPIEGIYKSYTTENLGYYKIGIIKIEGIYKAIILESEFKNWKPGEVKMIIESSALQGLYAVKLFMANKKMYETFASLENNVFLSMEMKNMATSTKRLDKFVKLFPPVEGATFNKKQNAATGSGFLLSTNGSIATNAHVIADAENIEVLFSNEKGLASYKAKVLITDKKNDVAILKIDDDKYIGPSNIPYSIYEGAEIGSKVFTIGYPLNDIMGSNYKVNDGIISAKSGVSDDIRYYQISVPLQPGNSGGPLFDVNGNVIGLTAAKLDEESIGISIENVNYAIKAAYLNNLLKMMPDPINVIGKSDLSNKELKEQIKVLKNYVCLIKVY